MQGCCSIPQSWRVPHARCVQCLCGFQTPVCMHHDTVGIRRVHECLQRSNCPPTPACLQHKPLWDAMLQPLQYACSRTSVPTYHAKNFHLVMTPAAGLHMHWQRTPKRTARLMASEGRASTSTSSPSGTPCTSGSRHTCPVTLRWHAACAIYAPT